MHELLAYLRERCSAGPDEYPSSSGLNAPQPIEFTASPSRNLGADYNSLEPAKLRRHRAGATPAGVCCPIEIVPPASLDTPDIAMKRILPALFVLSILAGITAPADAFVTKSFWEPQARQSF